MQARSYKIPNLRDPIWSCVLAPQAQRALIDERRKNAKRTPFRNRFGGGSSTSGSGNCDGSANSGERKENHVQTGKENQGTRRKWALPLGLLLF